MEVNIKNQKRKNYQMRRILFEIIKNILANFRYSCGKLIKIIRKGKLFYEEDIVGGNKEPFG